MRKIIENKLGEIGTIISFSKSDYRKHHPDNIVVFNSNIIVDNKKYWFGDIDVTLSKEKLIDLSKQLNNTIYILYEMDGRYDYENNPNIDNYVIKFNSDGTFKLNKRLKDFYDI